jgi:hypothetical protein
MASVAGGGHDRVSVEWLSVKDQAVHIEDDSVGFAGQVHSR